MKQIIEKIRKYFNYSIIKIQPKYSNKVIKQTIEKIRKNFNYSIKTILFKQTIEKIRKNFNYSIKTILFKHRKKTDNVPEYKFVNKISNFNKYLITLISLLFIYLFYLTVPTLYEKNWVQNTIEKQLLNEFKINFSLSSEISYRILPSPNFTIKNAKILNDDLENPKILFEIKTLKVFISQSNFFKKNIALKKILINNANISIQKKDFSFFQSFLNQKFSKKEIKIKNSNLFFKDFANETLLINKINELDLYYDNQKLLNTIYSKSEIFNNSYDLRFNKDLENKKNVTLIKFQKLKINYDNESTNKNKTINGINKISVLNSKLNTKYKFKNEKFTFESVNSKLNNNNIEYNGLLNLKPFDLNLKIDLEKIYLRDLLNVDSILFQLFKSGQLFNSNLSVNISLNSPGVLDHRLINDLKLKFNIKDERINFNNSSITINKIGAITLTKSKLTYKDFYLMFSGDFVFNIDDHDKFFYFFQTPKNNRKPIESINFSIDFDFQNNQLILNNVNINKIKLNLETKTIIDNFNLAKKSKKINLIELKNLINRIINSYHEG
ncbi:hypothetical protein OAL81_01405 [Candidatus Pelagibacter sp.]|nr:hypothetical protein [Candidatus Pelagibacter sp.]